MDFEKFFEDVIKTAEKEGLNLTEDEKETLEKAFKKVINNIIKLRDNHGIVVQNTGKGEVKIVLEYKDQKEEEFKSREIYYENKLRNYILLKRPVFILGVIGAVYFLTYGIITFKQLLSKQHVNFLGDFGYPMVIGSGFLIVTFLSWKFKRDKILYDIDIDIDNLQKNHSTNEKALETIKKLKSLKKKSKIFGIF